MSSSFNVYRKLWHAAGLLIPFMFYVGIFDSLSPYMDYPTRTIGILLLILLTGGVLLLDLLRLRFAFWNRLFKAVAGPLLKEEEERRINATVPYFFSMILLLIFFSYELVVLGALYLMLGDPAAAWAGARFGKNRFGNGKSAEGLAGFVISSFLSGVLFIIIHTAVHDGSSVFSFGFASVTVVLTGAVASACAELYSGTAFFGLLDDNLIVPLAGALAAALAGWIVFSFPAEAVFFNPVNLFLQRISL